MVGIDIAGQRGQGSIGHTDRDRRHMLERVRHGKQQDVHSDPTGSAVRATHRRTKSCHIVHRTALARGAPLPRSSRLLRSVGTRQARHFDKQSVYLGEFSLHHAFRGAEMVCSRSSTRLSLRNSISTFNKTSSGPSCMVSTSPTRTTEGSLCNNCFIRSTSFDGAVSPTSSPRDSLARSTATARTTSPTPIEPMPSKIGLLKLDRQIDRDQRDHLPRNVADVFQDDCEDRRILAAPDELEEADVSLPSICLAQRDHQAHQR